MEALDVFAPINLPEPPTRFCANPRCGKKLSRYNKAEQCHACEQRDQAAAFARVSRAVRDEEQVSADRGFRGVRVDAARKEGVPKRAVRQCATPGCGNVLSPFNHGTLCWKCDPPKAKRPAAPKPPDDGMCRRGCGRERHRGGCPAGLPKPVPVDEMDEAAPDVGQGETADLQLTNADVEEAPAAEPEAGHAAEELKEEMKTQTGTATTSKRRGQFDLLQSEAIAWDEVPTEAAPAPRKTGRMGEILEKLFAHDREGKGLGEKVSNRDERHASYTLQHIRKRMEKMGRELDHRRDPDMKTIYLRLKPVQTDPGNTTA